MKIGRRGLARRKFQPVFISLWINSADRNFTYVPLCYRMVNVGLFGMFERETWDATSCSVAILNSESFVQQAPHRSKVTEWPVSRSERQRTRWPRYMLLLKLYPRARASAVSGTAWQRAVFLNELPHRRVFAFALTISDTWMRPERWESCEAKAIES